jgi:hypothetical protein
MRRLWTFSYPSELRQFDYFSSSRDPFDRARRCAGALVARASAGFRLRALHLASATAHRSDISGGPSGWFSGASDRSGPIALQDATACIAIPSKMNDMRANRRVLRGLARMLHRYPQKKLFAKEATAQEQTT